MTGIFSSWIKVLKRESFYFLLYSSQEKNEHGSHGFKLAHCSPTAYLPSFNTNDKERKKELVDKTKATIKVMTSENGGTRRGKRRYSDVWGRICLRSSPGPTLFMEVNIPGSRAGVNILFHEINWCDFI